jgi:hypothetical protein
VWRLAQLDRDWRLSLVSVLIDLAMGIALLAAVSSSSYFAFAPIFVTWSLTRAIGRHLPSVRDVLLRSQHDGAVTSLVAPILTIRSIWCAGRTLAAVLFALIVSVYLIVISIASWGVREITVVTFLTAHGLSTENALRLPVCFEFVVIVASLPGALIVAIYSPGRADQLAPE